MAVNPSAVWRVRTAGSNTNGGGYDALISGAGTDYSQQNAAQVSGTAGTATGSTAFSDVVANNFTSAMIGNALYLTGTGLTTGFYFVIAFTSSSAVTLDRSPGTGTVGTWHLGGAWADPQTNLASGGPVLPGNVIYVRAGGTGSTSAPDYAGASYVTLPNGDSTNGYIKIIGENGRPYIRATSGLFYFQNNYIWLEGMYLFAGATGGFGNYGFIGSSSDCVMRNMVLDQNGHDVTGVSFGGAIEDSEILSSVANSGTAGGFQGINAGQYGLQVKNCNIHDCWGIGILLNSGASISGGIVAKCRGDGIQVDGAAGFAQGIQDVTVDANNSHGINILTAIGLSQITIVGCIISNHVTAGKYGINTTTGTLAVNDRVRSIIDYNSYFNNTNNSLNLTVGTGVVTGTQLHDNIGIDPQYVAQSTENYAIGTNLVGLGYPQSAYLQSKAGQTTGVRSYMDAGGVQRVAATAGIKSNPSLAGAAQ